MLDHNEKLKLIIELIGAGVTDATIVIANVKKIETKLFNSNSSSNLTKNGRKLQKKGLLNSKNLNKE